MLRLASHISSSKLVIPIEPGRLKPNSYSVSVGCFIDSSGTVSHDHNYKLHPQSIVWVISKETISLPPNTTAIAHIRTSWCSVGVLALNTGIIDPGWNGPISTPLINFGKTTQLIRYGDEFLRVTFHEHDMPPHGTKFPEAQPHSIYVPSKQTLASLHFGTEFLDARRVLKSATRRIFWRMVLGGSAVATVGALIFAIATLVVSYGESKIESVATQRSLSAIEERLGALENNPRE